MNSQFFNDYVSFCRSQGKTGKEILKGWRKIKHEDFMKEAEKVRSLFCQKFGFDESLTDSEISLELFLRENGHE